MTNTVLTIITVLSFINILRIFVFFVLGDLYELERAYRDKRFAKKIYIPLVSVIVPAYNEGVVIYRTLQSIIQSDYKKYEIIVVSDGSKDNTSNEVRRFIKDYKVKNIRLVEQENGGKGRALNNGIKNYAKGELVITLDADSILASNAITNAVKYFKDPEVVALAANIKVIDNKRIISIIQLIEYMMGNRLKKSFMLLNMDYVVGGAGATFRKSVLERLNYFDTDTITEDLDLTLKIIKDGNKKNRMLCAPDVICYTEGPIFFNSLRKQRRRWKLGKLQTLYKNRDLFFNSNSKYTKTFTMFFLPYALINEAMLFLDPLLIFVTLYYIIKSHDLFALIAVLLFIGFYTIVTILSDEYITLRQKIRYIAFSPLAYFFFYSLTVIEFLALLGCVKRFKTILFAKERDECAWQPPERLGGDLSPQLTAAV